jgi:cytochrome c oxidase subunit 2
VLRSVFYLVLSLCLLLKKGQAAYQLNMPYGVTPISHRIYNLHMTVFYVSCVIAAIVFIILIYSLIRFRKSKGAKPASFHSNLWIEIIWTTIPFFILIGLAIPATVILGEIHDTSRSAVTIKVTGYQWKWKYAYLDNGVEFFSFLSTPVDQVNNQAPKNPWYLLEVDKPLVVPINTKVRLLITSDDVIHNWWVPELGVKQDAIPGFINENWFYITKPGDYRGQCGELCGINHAYMPIVVHAVSPGDYQTWVRAQQKTAMANNAQFHQKNIAVNDLLKTGQDEYLKNCAMCHQANGEGLSTSFPALRDSRVVNAPMEETIAYILHGVPGTPMQAFGQVLDDQRLAAIITYIRQAWGNAQFNVVHHYNLIVQPEDVTKVRQEQGE